MEMTAFNYLRLAILLSLLGLTSLAGAKSDALLSVKVSTAGAKAMKCKHGLASLCTLAMATNSFGAIEITNLSTSITARNIKAFFPFADVFDISSEFPCDVVPPGATCEIDFASSGITHPATLVPVKGDNTRQVEFTLIVGGPPPLTVIAPVQQNRLVAVSGAALPLIVRNDSPYLSASFITVTDTTACPNLSINDTDCFSVAPGGSCTLELSSTTPYAPCTVTISGDNTSSTQALVAFSYQGGLVFESDGVNGKVVLDSSLEFSSQWTSIVSDIAGAESETNGLPNTFFITINASCTGDPSNCAAQQCRNIGLEWYLPAVAELQSVNDALCANGNIPCNFGNFQSSVYQSSSQNPMNSAQNFTIVFPGGFYFPQSKTANAPTGYPVRCIKTF